MGGRGRNKSKKEVGEEEAGEDDPSEVENGCIGELWRQICIEINLGLDVVYGVGMANHFCMLANHPSCAPRLYGGVDGVEGAVWGWY